METLPAIPDAEAKALARAAQEEQSSELGKLLKFVKGHFYIGDDEIALGREYVAYADQWTRGWVKFEGGVPTAKHIGRAIDGFKVADRMDLGDLDQSKWERDSSGNPKDPWSRQSYLPFEDVESGEIVIFVSGSQGGRGAIGNLCGSAANNHRRGHPRIKLGVSSYKHRVYGRIEVPDFPVVGWTGGLSGAAEPPKPIQAEMSDEIPF
jgi:hypothetical protein